MTALGVLVGLLASLPLAVYAYAGVLGMFDQPNRTRAVVTLAFRVVLVCLLLAALPEGTRWSVGAGFLLVLGLHAAAFVGLRRAVLSGRWITDRYE